MKISGYEGRAPPWSIDVSDHDAGRNSHRHAMAWWRRNAPTSKPSGRLPLSEPRRNYPYLGIWDLRSNGQGLRRDQSIDDPDTQGVLAKLVELGEALDILRQLGDFQAS
ncbi:hypothetical protein ACVJBD_000071 [Rhizobium mongolense]